MLSWNNPTDQQESFNYEYWPARECRKHQKQTRTMIAGHQEVSRAYEDMSGSGVYPMSDPDSSKNVPIQPPASWGQGDRGADGYQDSGTSKVFVPDELQTQQWL